MIFGDIVRFIAILAFAILIFALAYQEWSE